MFMLKAVRDANAEHVPSTDVEVFDPSPMAAQPGPLRRAIDRLWGTSNASQTLIGGNAGDASPGVPLLPSLDTELFTRFIDVRTIYRTNPWLYAVINLKARSYSRMPPKLYQPGKDFNERATGRGAQLEQVLRRPGGGVSPVVLRLGTFRDKMTRGNALWRLHTTSTGQITGIERIPWCFVRVTDTFGELLYTDTRHSNGDWREHTFTAAEVIHFGLWEDDTAVAESPIRTLHSTLALFDSVYTHLLSYFARGARPSGHFHIDAEAGDVEVDRVAEMIKTYFTGAANAGRVLITSAKWESTSDNPDHSKVIELAKQSREEICGAFGVSPPLVGILDRAIMSNVRELREHTTRDTVGPDVELLDSTFNAQLFEHHPIYRKFWLESEIGATLKADIDGIAASIPNRLRIETPNEIRKTHNKPPITDDPNADLIWAPNAASDSSGSEGGDSKPEAEASLFTRSTPED